MTDEESEPVVDTEQQVRVALARLYHNVMIDLAMKGEARVNRRRFWRDEDGVIHWEDLDE
jgi:hypothetical protein